MKKVRFESPEKAFNFKMNDLECHSPRPFLDYQFRSKPPEIPCNYERVLPFSSDPVQRFETDNSSPYPTVSKTNVLICSKESPWSPSNDLDLSLLDASNHEPRNPLHKTGLSSDENLFRGIIHRNVPLANNCKTISHGLHNNILKPIENNSPPNVLVKDNSFFIRRDNLDKYQDLKPLHNQMAKLCVDKENDPFFTKAELMRQGPLTKPVVPANIGFNKSPVLPNLNNSDCGCHHCFSPETPRQFIDPRTNIGKLPNHHHTELKSQNMNQQLKKNLEGNNCYGYVPPKICAHCQPSPIQPVCKPCHCQPQVLPPNAVDKKTWALEKFEQKKSDCTELEKQTTVSKEKREPTVADLFKIIKLQNEQLQLLQEKVDKFISSSRNLQPTISCSSETVSVNNVDNEQVRMSIGVMTSFEMVRTSTVINKEVLKQNENSQIQCNKSQISIKEVVSKPVNINFLDGIMPVQNFSNEQNNLQNEENNVQSEQKEVGDEKTLNELSLYNVQVDNATTPLISPDQTLYLDVRDYSDSESGTVDQSNVGWTYYNKVMTHVNGMLQDSEMPSSASAMYRNMRQHCVQMQIDKTNVSVTKRVKFGDDPLGVHQPHLYPAASTDTSLKMNQLAAKYLKIAPTPPPAHKHTAPIDMSFATRNYMERHRLIQGPTSSSKPPQQNEIPRFLDITALKQQPKFL